MSNRMLGPWEVVIDGTCSAAWPQIVPLGTSLDDVNEECIAELSSVYLERSTDGMPESWVEKPERFDKSPDHDEVMKMACLIAAAPDLLIELRQAVIQMEMAAECIESKRYDEALLHVSSLMRSKRAAIAKATGE